MTDPVSDPFESAFQAARAEGLLPANARRPVDDSRPWPVVLLTGVGAWFAAVPMLAVVGLLFGDLMRHGSGPYVVGMLVLAGAIVVLRSQRLPLFVEQLAVPALLVGGGSLGFGLFSNLPLQAAAAVLVLVALGTAMAIDRTWLRALLGALAAGLFMLALSSESWFHKFDLSMLWLSLHGLLAAWLLAMWLQHSMLTLGRRAQWAAALETIAAGWLVVTLFGLAALAGMSFLVAGSLGGSGSGFVGGLAQEFGRKLAPENHARLMQSASAGFAVVTVLLTARAWPSVRKPPLLCLAAVLVLLAGLLPTLGAVLLVLALLATTGRWRLAGAAAFAAAWIVGSVYYLTQWPLATKALFLVLAAVVLAVLAWLMQRQQSVAASSVKSLPMPGTERRAQGLIAATMVLTLGVANFAIWQKEDVIAHGQPVFIQLAPVDPRSLMQGDYMRLNFSAPSEVTNYPLDPLASAQRPYVVARRDSRGVASLLRIAQADVPLAEGEFRIELTPKDGRWVVVSDAWFFKEGEAQRWAAAKYGEFRVNADGKALLVGMADVALRPIAP